MARSQLLWACLSALLSVSLAGYINPRTSEEDLLSDIWASIDSDNAQPHNIQERSPQRGFPSLKESFSLSEIVNFVHRSEQWNGTWVSDTEYAYRNRDGALALFSVVSGQSTTLAPPQVLEQPRVFKYWLSPDLQYILMAVRPQKLFRHSFIALYDIYNIRTGQRTTLQPPASVLRDFGPPEGPGFGPPGRPKGPQQLPLLFATWSPTGNALAYVFRNNIYYRESPESNDVAITSTGIPGVVFNGIADWVYEEEVISDTKALWFSPDNRHLAWIEFNDTEVEVMPLQVYGQPNRLEFQYPIPTPLSYPKPGRTNPFVNVYVADVSTRSPRSYLLEPPTYFGDREKIIYAVTWANNKEVSLTWENRHQNYSIVSICDVAVANCRDSLVMTEPNGWLELDQAPVFTQDGRQFAMSLSADGFKHVNVINRDTNQRIPITSGNMVVTEIFHWDEKQHVIYFEATRVGAPGERHLYTVTDFDSGRPGIVTCISCDVVNSRGGACGYNQFEFSTQKSYFTLSCQGPHVPQEYLFKAPGQKIATLVTNDDLSDALAAKNLPKISNLDVKIDGGRHVAKVRLYLPHNFNERKQYPLLVNVYGGPNSQQVNDKFKLDWGTYLTTSEEVIYAVIDGRGSGYRGDDILFSSYYNIGQNDAQDQIDVTKKLISLYSFIDATNVAIWGWSYGGFMSIKILEKDADQSNIFKCGMAVAPVTSWIYYDSIYTERYMGLPNPGDNIDGYNNADTTKDVEKLRNKKLFIAHGTGDDNVHYQNSLMIIRALEEADILFQEHTYTDENHGIVGLRPHLYHSLTNFLLNDCFGRNEVVKG
ncbi:hypothetical protein TCAL_02614 [Tigriopus californicus]|uniref:Venom dipeptidyl peptidase 4 n=1 Tax=Tigriopus californicus TaxID=6832 RepID=A0A553NFR7_TIGCA|nr:venom dipeptidyl peptidase 4-like [Tigriopus californicus]TRY64286.1 hypothetical protein TCAL_02614 [Tigriopus californicus]